MRNCSDCGSLYEPTGRTWRCLPCRRIWEREWRQRRKAEGRPVVTGKRSYAAEEQQRKSYFSRPDVREKRAANMKRYRNDPILRVRHDARWKLNREIAAGRIERQPCEVCGERAQAHHDDYNKPLDVRWLCRSCHRAHHAAAEAAGKTSKAKTNRCSPCRRKFDKAWRARRAAEGRPVTSSPDPAGYQAAYARQRRLNPTEQPKLLARAVVGHAVIAGRIERAPCAVCGALPSEAHHSDYSKPLDVTWLCRAHHRELHKAEG